MKIQWSEQNLRVRITPEDLSRLERSVYPLERLYFPGGAWSFTLERGKFTTLEMRGETLIFSLSESDFLKLLEPDREGLYFSGVVEFCIEKDRHVF